MALEQAFPTMIANIAINSKKKQEITKKGKQRHKHKERRQATYIFLNKTLV